MYIHLNRTRDMEPIRRTWDARWKQTDGRLQDEGPKHGLQLQNRDHLAAGDTLQLQLLPRLPVILPGFADKILRTLQCINFKL